MVSPSRTTLGSILTCITSEFPKTGRQVQTSADHTLSELVYLETIATKAHEYTPALEERGERDFFHRIWKSLTRRDARGRRWLNVQDRILDGATLNCREVLSEILRNKCKTDSVSLTHSGWHDSIVWYVSYALNQLVQR